MGRSSSTYDSPDLPSTSGGLYSRDPCRDVQLPNAGWRYLSPQAGGIRSKYEPTPPPRLARRGDNRRFAVGCSQPVVKTRQLLRSADGALRRTTGWRDERPTSSSQVPRVGSVSSGTQGDGQQSQRGSGGRGGSTRSVADAGSVARTRGPQHACVVSGSSSRWGLRRDFISGIRRRATGRDGASPRVASVAGSRTSVSR